MDAGIQSLDEYKIIGVYRLFHLEVLMVIFPYLACTTDVLKLVISLFLATYTTQLFSPSHEGHSVEM